MNSWRDLLKTLDNLLLKISLLLFNFKFNMISSTYLISSVSAGHVRSFHCIWFQKIFEKKRSKNHAYQFLSAGRFSQ